MPAPPGALVLASPWCDLSGSRETPGSTADRFKNIDYIYVTKGYTYHIEAFLGPHGFEAAANNKYISPACKSLAVDFKRFPRTFIIAGGSEMLLDEIKTLRARTTKDLGEGKVKYLEEPDAVHDFLGFKWWHAPERRRTLKDIARWIDVAA